MIELREDWLSVDFEQIIDLYDSVGWSAYTKDPKSLKKAFENSTYCLVAMDQQKVVGISRSISDLVSIHYLQDILVHPDYQKRGIGRKVLTHLLEYFGEVRTHMILTDDEQKQLRFYESMGYKNIKDLEKFPLNSYVMMKGIELV